MPYYVVLNIVRICCLAQCVLVVFFTIPDGFSQIEIGAIALSISFGLIISGFTRNILHANALETKKKELDEMVEDLMEQAEDEQKGFETD